MLSLLHVLIAAVIIGATIGAFIIALNQYLRTRNRGLFLLIIGIFVLPIVESSILAINYADSEELESTLTSLVEMFAACITLSGFYLLFPKRFTVEAPTQTQ